jgi:anti-sigma factor RsiW
VIVMKSKIDHIGEKIDAYLDGELTFWQRRKVNKHLKNCESCQQQLQEHRNVSLQVHTLPIQSCPDYVIDRVMQRTQQARRTKNIWSRLEVSLNPLFNWRLATGFAVAAAVVLCLVLWPRSREESVQPHQYTPEEVAQAKLDVERALGYFAEVLNRTQKTIEEEVVPEQVVKPLKKGLHVAFGSLNNNGG